MKNEMGPAYLEQLFLHSAHLNSWHYDVKHDSLTTDCPDSLEYADNLEDSIKNHMQKDDMYIFPSLLITQSHIAYGIIPEKDKPGNGLNILGPVFIHQYDTEDSYTGNPPAIPKMSIREFENYIMLYNHAVNKENDVIKIYDLSRSFSPGISSDNILSMLSESVKKGDLNYRQHMFDLLANRSTVIDMGTVTFESGRDLAVVSADVSAAAALSAGVSKKTVDALYDKYIPSLRATDDALHMTWLINTFIYHLVRLVRHLKRERVYTVQIQNCVTYIEENIQQKLTLELLAKKVGYSCDYLSKIFKKEIGYSVNDYIMNLKVENAKLMLTITETPIGEIAEKLSFCSNSHFASIFKKYTGYTPLQYRNHYSHLI